MTCLNASDEDQNAILQYSLVPGSYLGFDEDGRSVDVVDAGFEVNRL